MKLVIFLASTFARKLKCIEYPHDLAPRGHTVDHYMSRHGSLITVADPYRFLEDPNSPETKKWVEAENELTDEFLATCDQR
jgi:prolyl oligopeptidase